MIVFRAHRAPILSCRRTGCRVGSCAPPGVGWDIIYPGNAQGFSVTASANPWPNWTLYVDYLTGNNVSNSMSLLTYEAGVIYAFPKGPAIRVLYRDLVLGGVDQQNVYRAQLDYSF